MTDATSERKAFKDYFDRAAARSMAAQVGGAMARFDSAKFARLAAKNIETLEFADRVKQFSNALAETLPDSIPKALAVLTASLPAELPDCEAVTDGLSMAV
ncbi:hypothetical protein ACFL2H_07070 [Planctomycetota bacterium]